MSEAEKKKKIAVTLYTTGSNAVKTSNLDYAIDCFFKCARLVPENLIYRQSLRAAEKKKYKDNRKGAAGASLRAQGTWVSIKVSKTRKKWHDVIVSAEEILQLNPWEADALLEICNACRELGDEMDQVGLWVAQTAVDANKERADLHRNLADWYEKNRKFNEAINSLEAAKRLDPNDTAIPARIRQLAADNTIERGGYETASSEGGEESDDDDSPAEKASPVIKANIVAAPPETAEAKAKRELQEAEARFAASPSDIPLALQLAEAHRKVGDYLKAARTLEAANKAAPGDEEVAAKLSEVKSEGFKRKLDQIRQQQSKLNRQSPTFKDDFAKLEKQANGCNTEIMKAEIALLKLRVSQNNDDYTAHLDLGVRLHDVGEVDDAIKSLQRARGDIRQKWKALLYLGKSFWKKKNYALADKNLTDSLAAAPQLDETARKEIWYTRGCVAMDSNQKDIATDCFNEVAAIDYGYKDVAKRLDALNSGESHVEEASEDDE